MTTRDFKIEIEGTIIDQNEDETRPMTREELIAYIAEQILDVVSVDELINRDDNDGLSIKKATLEIT